MNSYEISYVDFGFLFCHKACDKQKNKKKTTRIKKIQATHNSATKIENKN